MTRSDRPTKQHRKSPLWSRSRKKVAALFAAVIAVLLVLFSAFFIVSGSADQPPPSAAIVDQLSLTFPNPGFVQAATSTLQDAGYSVDYYPGEEVTVELYRELPTHGYQLILLRVHSALLEEDLVAPQDPPPPAEDPLAGLEHNVFLFTSELYTPTRYVDEQRALRVGPARYYAGSSGYTKYFSITSHFVTSGMRGQLDRATIILMGCDGLTFDTTAAAFVQRGARAVVGWDGSVSAGHTDAATQRLLQYLVTEQVPIDQAVAMTMTEVGPDPTYGSSLILYPPE